MDKISKDDEIIKQDGISSPFDVQPKFYVGVSVLIDKGAVFSLLGSTMDFVEDELSEKFVFNNPNIKGSCGCGESFMLQ